MTKEGADKEDGQAVIFIPFSSLAMQKIKVFDGYLKKNLLSKKCEDILAHV